MTTIALNLKDEIRDFLYTQIEYGNTPSVEGFLEDAVAKYKADLARREEQLYEDVLEAEEDYRAGRYYTGNLVEVLKKFKEDEARV